VLADDDSSEIDAAWMRCFVTAAVFDLLAESAIEGAVEARVD
jgi:hypothetical protein